MREVAPHLEHQGALKVDIRFGIGQSNVNVDRMRNPWRDESFPAEMDGGHVFAQDKLKGCAIEGEREVRRIHHVELNMQQLDPFAWRAIADFPIDNINPLLKRNLLKLNAFLHSGCRPNQRLRLAGSGFGSDQERIGLITGVFDQLIRLLARAFHCFELSLHDSGLPLHMSHAVPRGLSSTTGFESLPANKGGCDDSDAYKYPLRGCVPGWRLALVAVIVGSSAFAANRWGDRDWVLLLAGLGYLGGALFGLAPWAKYNCQTGQPYCENKTIHGGESVTQKYLTPHNLCNTLTLMANVLSTDKQIAAISALTEGSSIRSIERMTGVHRDTIMRLGVKVGQGCARLMDSKMRDLPCIRLEMDEIWGFVGKKERNVRLDEPAPVGNVWTFCAIDADTKLVPAFKVGDRSIATAKAFVGDVASRMRNRVQISTDGLRAYVEAVESAFGTEVDYAQIVKTYGHEEVSDNRRYSAPDFVSSEKKVITGNPDERLISTSYVERLNATTRLHMRRLTRLTLAFSKKRENFEAAVALHFAYYNFVKRHNTLRCTPAMAAGVERDFWSVGRLLEAATA